MPVEKIVVQTFIESLSMRPSKSFQADVHSWWKKVGSYLEVAEKKSPKSVVQIARQVYDESASLGHDLGSESLPALLHKATVGLANTVAVIFVSKDVKMAETCTVPCYLHGVHGNINSTILNFFNIFVFRSEEKLLRYPVSEGYLSRVINAGCCVGNFSIVPRDFYVCGIFQNCRHCHSLSLPA